MDCNIEVEIFCKYYFGTDHENINNFTNEWESLKFELISMNQKWFQLNKLINWYIKAWYQCY